MSDSRLYFKSKPKTPSTGLSRLPATPTTPLAAARIWSTEASELVSEPAMLKAKPATGDTNGITRDMTTEISGAIMDLVSGKAC